MKKTKQLFLALVGVCMVASDGWAYDEPDSSRFDASIARLARFHDVPERLIRRVIMRESRYAPGVANHGHYGLMQIKLETARSMGYQGDAHGLLDGETNLNYAVPYLANAYLAAGRDEDGAVRLYAGGYYYAAKRRGLLADLHTGDKSYVSPTSEIAIAYAAQAQEEARASQASNPFATIFAPNAATTPQEVALADNGMQDAAEIDFPERPPLPPKRPRGL